MKSLNKFDIIVVGAGHAGVEAALIVSKLNLKIALITLDKKTIGEMPCNPSIGGPAKGIVTREIDVLGGIQAKAADATQLQMKLLNISKGAGVWALRSQIDKKNYHLFLLKQIKKDKNITLIESNVIDLLVDKNNIKGVSCSNKKNYYSDAVILTTGTYLNSTTHIGKNKKDSGPNGWKYNNTLSPKLKKLGFELLRLKTGTPPRIKSSTIDFSKIDLEPGTNMKLSFSHFNKVFLDYKKQLPCYLTYTNDKTHEIINKNINKSSLFSGNINGVGPRYCPSIEDKVKRFFDKSRHQIFVEPESKKFDIAYLGGLSTSLPENIQKRIVNSIRGLEKAEIVKYAYAIEYDAINPIQLFPTLEAKKISGLFFAGQINGTSGYEEAACQGLIAGINAVSKIKNFEPLILRRDEAYIGVLIDDLVNKGVTDPYRLLTSRAEYRLLLRNDNVIDRLLKYSIKYQLLSPLELKIANSKINKTNEIINFLKSKKVGQIKELKNSFKKTNITLFNFIKQQEISLKNYLEFFGFKNIDDEIIQRIEIEAKYEGYIKNQNLAISKLKELNKIKLPKLLDYKKIPNLSLEAIEKLNKIKPLSLEQAKSISGINLIDIAAIKYYIENNNYEWNKISKRNK